MGDHELFVRKLRKNGRQWMIVSSRKRNVGGSIRMNDGQEKCRLSMQYTNRDNSPYVSNRSML